MLTSELWKASLAVDRLNSWVRSDSYGACLSNGAKRAVYYLKTCATAELHAANAMLEARRVVTHVQCRDCAGGGRYIDDMGYRFTHCRRCKSTGRAILEFVESTFCLPDIITWHTPVAYWSLPQDTVSPQLYQTGWTPNQSGRDLTPAEVAEAFNTAEEYFTKRPPIVTTDFGYSYAFDYSLPLGRTDAQKCRLCGDPVSPKHAYGCQRDLFTWSDYACCNCDAAYKERRRVDPAGGSIFDAFPVPAELSSHPAIQRWQQRHFVEHAKLADYVQQRRAWRSAS